MDNKTLLIISLFAVILAAVVYLQQTPSSQPFDISALSQQQTTPDNTVTTLTTSKPTVRSSEQTSALDAWFSSSDPAWAWSRVDMEDVREKLPNNLYWELAAPSKDPLVLELREERKERLNKQYGKILSGKAAHEDISSYYEHRQQVSTDYIAFTDHMLTVYTHVLPKRDIRLLNLTRNLHTDHLHEIPQQREDAIKRSSAFSARRDEWLADKAAFEAKLEAEVKQ